MGKTDTVIVPPRVDGSLETWFRSPPPTQTKREPRLLRQGVGEDGQPRLPERATRTPRTSPSSRWTRMAR